MARRQGEPPGSLRKLPSGKWQARFPHPVTRRLTASPLGLFQTKQAAREWLWRVDEAVKAGKWQPGWTGYEMKPTLSEVRSQYLNRPGHALRVSTAKNYNSLWERRIAPTFAGTPVDQITRDDVREWYRALSPETLTVNAEAGNHLKALLKFATEEGHLAVSPANGMKFSKPERKIRKDQVLTMAELAAYIQAADEHDRAMLAVAAFCGLRSGELRALTLADIDWDRAVLTVNKNVYRVKGVDHVGLPKTKAGDREVDIPGQALAALRAHVERNNFRRATALLFPGADGGHMTDRSLSARHHKTLVRIGRRESERARKKLGASERMNSPRLHDLRASIATSDLQRGVLPNEVMERYGWSTMGMLVTYGRIARERSDALAAERNSAIDAAFASDLAPVVPIRKGA